jgi:phage protein D
MSPGAGTMLSFVEVAVDGRPLSPDTAMAIIEVRVDQGLRLPDRCSLRISDPEFELIDRAAFPLGARLQASFTAPDNRELVSLFDGEVVALEPEYTLDGTLLALVAFDKSHRLDRTRRTQTWQQTTYGAIARAAAGRNGLTAGTVQTAGGTLPFVQQSNETDWQLLWRLADEIGFEVGVEGSQLHFRPAAAAQPPRSPTRLVWGEQMIAFRPRATGVQQVDEVEVRGWDPATKQAIVASSSPATAGTEIGIPRSEAVDGLGGGKAVVADRPVMTQQQAVALADGIAKHLASAFVEAEGTIVGDPRLKAGGAIEVAGVGERFGGTYVLSSATHLFRAARGYETRFAVSARPAKPLGEIASPPHPHRSWRRSVVVGEVTNNNDPDQLGRVRVTYPALGADHEGWWARIAVPAAGDRRGVLMLPRVGDEVLLAFEHDDTDHPYVIGSLWNGRAKPQQLAHVDGSLAIRSDKQIVVEAVEDISITGDKKMTLTAKGDATLTTEPSGGNLALTAKGTATLKSGSATTVEATTDGTIDAKGKLKVKGGTQLEIESGGRVSIKAATLQIQATGGPVQITGTQVLLG